MLIGPSELSSDLSFRSRHFLDVYGEIIYYLYYLMALCLNVLCSPPNSEFAVRRSQ